MYSIGQFAKKTGLTVRAIRFYSDKGLLVPCYVSEAGHRYFDDGHIMTVQKIMTLKYLDYTLEEIERLLVNEGTNLVASLQFQREELEKKKKQLDLVIMNLDQAIAIGQKSKVIEPTIFLSVIHNLLKEEEQKDYLRQYLPESLIEKLYTHLGVNLIEMNDRYIHLAYQIKQAYREPIADRLLQSYIEQFMLLIPQELAMEIAICFEEQQQLEIDDWLFPSPFTKDEEDWFFNQAKRLGLYGGVDDE